MDSIRKLFFFDEESENIPQFLECLESHAQFVKNPFEVIPRDQEKDIEHPVMVVMGGDGSLHRGLNWLGSQGRLSQVDILYHPAGTGNDFARSVGLQPTDMEKSVENLFSGHTENLFLGDLNGHLFINMGTFGSFAEVTPKVDPFAKKIMGHWSYYLEGIRGLLDLDSFSCEFGDEYGKWHESEIFGFFVSKCRYTGGGVQVSPDQSPRSPDFDFLVVRNMSTMDLIGMGLEMQKEDPDLNGFNAVFKKVTELRFRGDKPISVTLDGEKIKLREGSIQIAKQKARLILPSEIL